VIIQTFTHPSDKTDQMSVFIDEDVKLLKIEIRGVNAETDVDITDPRGKQYEDN